MLEENNLYQDNESCILMANKGREVLSKRTRAMNVRYFAIKDSIEKGLLKIFHLPTNRMLGDFFTKPLQGKRFYEFRNLILGVPVSSGDTDSHMKATQRA